METIAETERQLFKIGLVFMIALPFILLIQYLLDSRLHLECSLYRVTGFYCPSCGGTRSFQALMRGDILKSLSYHPVVLYGTVVFIAFMGSNGVKILTGSDKIKGMKYRNFYIYTGLVIIMVHFILRNMLLHMYGIRL